MNSSTTLIQVLHGATLMSANMSYTITTESPATLTSSWFNLQHLRWDHIFTLPCWLEVWWHEFGADTELYLRAVRHGEDVIGIAPLLLKKDQACLIGSTDVCDYLDFVVAPGREQEFFDVILHDLTQRGITCLDLSCLRPDSITATNLITMARDRGYKVCFDLEDVSLELELPATWDEFLEILDSKQRHEVKRKLRRLEEAGSVEYDVTDDIEVIPQTIDIFLKLFRESREDKACFLTTRRESFFRSVSKCMGEAGLLKLGILRLDSSPVASVMYFDYLDRVYLYNSGYDPPYSPLSVGLLSKILCIKDSIEKGKKIFDFMKGAEPYKYRMRGKEIPIYRGKIFLT